MFYFTTEKSAGYGARIFLHSPVYPDQINEVVGLHELAKELSYWKGADKRVQLPPQDFSEALKKMGRDGSNGHVGATVFLSGYEMDNEELAVMKKRCKKRGLVDITKILSDVKQEWL